MHDIPLPRCAIILCGDEAPTIDTRLEETSNLIWLQAEPAAEATSPADGVRLARVHDAGKRLHLTPAELSNLLGSLNWAILVASPSPDAESLACGVTELLQGHALTASLFSACTHPSIEARVRAKIPALFHHRTDATLTPLTAALALVGSVYLPGKVEQLDFPDYQSIMRSQGTVTALSLPGGTAPGEALPLRELARIFSAPSGSIAYASSRLNFDDFATVCDICRKREVPYAVLHADQQGIPPAFYLFTNPNSCR